MKCEECGVLFTDNKNVEEIKDLGACISCQLKQEEDQENFQFFMGIK